MTDMPRVGILCAGKDSAELANSIYCASYITKILREAGYASGGYHTSLLADTSEKTVSGAKTRLLMLCKNCELVMTVGGDGFEKNDVIPDITRDICTENAEFFSSSLCGSTDISSYDEKDKERVLPSRSTAGIYRGTLVMNIRSDRDFIKKRLPTILPMINFALLGLSKRCAEDSARIRRSMEREMNA